MKPSAQSDGITPQLKTASASFATSPPSSPAAFSIYLRCQMGQQPCCITFVWMLCESGMRTRCWGDLRELVAWPLKFNIEQPSIVLNPCLHLLFVSERRLTSLIAYTVITNNILVYVVHLLCNMKINHNLGTLWRISLSLLQTLPARRYVLPCA